MSIAARLFSQRLANISSLKPTPFLSSGFLQLSLTKEYSGTDRPKQDRNAYLIYFEDQLPELRKKHPGELQTQLTSRIAKMYANLGDQEKAVLDQRQSEEVQQKIEEWNSLSDIERSAMVKESKQKAAMRKLRKETRKLRAEFESTDPPKRPPGIYIMFMKQWYSTEESLTFKNGGVRKATKPCSEAYKSLSPEDIQKLKEKHAVDLDAYHVKKVKWLRRLHQEGKNHLRKHLSVKPRAKLMAVKTDKITKEQSI